MTSALNISFVNASSAQALLRSQPALVAISVTSDPTVASQSYVAAPPPPPARSVDPLPSMDNGLTVGVVVGIAVGSATGVALVVFAIVKLASGSGATGTKRLPEYTHGTQQHVKENEII